MREEPVNSAVVGGHFNQVSAGVTEIDGGDRSLRTGSANRPVDDLHPVGAKTGHYIRHRHRRDQAEIRRTRGRSLCLGIKFMPRFMKVDFLVTEY